MGNLSSSSSSSWKGKRCISLVRQSDDSQGTTSTAAQLQWLRDEGERRGMTLVDEIVLNGITGSLPGKRADLDQLLQRKREKNDFEVLLVQRLDRLTRGGSNHGFWFEYECTKVGITIIYPGDDVPEDGRYAGLIKAAKFDAARDQARSIGQRSIQGVMHAIRQGRNCVVSRTPYGCDRLYLTSEGRPLFVIRNLTDGRQQKLDPETGAIIDTYGHKGGGARGHYRKQKDEHVLIVPGDPEKMRTVRHIFERHYNEGWGGKRIADELNRHGTPSPTGRGWSQRQVESIYENPIYCGEALGQRVSQGIYYRRGQEHPELVTIDAQTLANCQYAPRQLRAPDEWVWQEQPLMTPFLPEPLAAKALPEIKALLTARWQRSQDPTQPKRPTNKHKDSEYILTGRLVAKQDGEELTGVLCGRKGKQKRYYRHRKGRVGYRKGSVFNKLVPAAALETAVLTLVRHVVADTPNLRQRVLEAISHEAPVDDAHEQLAAAQRERDALAKRVQLIVQTLDEGSLADAKTELDRLAAERQALDDRIERLGRSVKHSNIDPDELADGVVARFEQLDAEWDSLSPAALRDLLTAFVERVEVDMASKDAAVVLRLPPWLPQNGDSSMCLAGSSASSTEDETHRLPLIRLAAADCHYEHVRGSTTQPPCYSCRRRTAA